MRGISRVARLMRSSVECWGSRVVGRVGDKLFGVTLGSRWWTATTRTAIAQASVIPPPHPENQLVLYLRGEQALRGMADRLTGRGHRPVAPANPYWARSGAVLFADPDGWLVVLTPRVFGEPPSAE
ncbi:hypothetical protein [Nocardia sp. NPDC057272]|uniref:hypothetical protein n=1 Tax=Nocardia sp. NPDC057272 TaxID=3346079 RepID=UPI00363890E3